MSSKYLYLRTNLPLKHSPTQLLSLSALDGYEPEILKIGNGAASWANGLLLRFYTRETPKQFAQYNRQFLTNFDAWACHDGLNRCAEGPLSGPVETFFKDLGSRSLFQLCIRHGRDEASTQRRLEELRAALDTKARVRPAFFLRDGQVFLIATLDPSTIVYRRCEACLTNSMDYTLIDDLDKSFASGSIAKEGDAWLKFPPSWQAKFG